MLSVSSQTSYKQTLSVCVHASVRSPGWIGPAVTFLVYHKRLGCEPAAHSTDFHQRNNDRQPHL